MADTNNNSVDEPTKPDALALGLILNEPQLELFCDSVGIPRIRLPPVRNSTGEEPWPLRSDRVRAWIADFVWERAAIILLDREIDRILNILEGKAWQDQRRDLELCEAIEQDSVLEAVLVYMESETLFEGTMTKFQHELAKAAKRAGLDVRSKNWPKGAPQLSRRIGSVERFLTKAGIRVDRSHKSSERRIRLVKTITNGTPSPPSQGPSLDKSHHPKGQRQNDTASAEKRVSLLTQISQPPERQNS